MFCQPGKTERCGSYVFGFADPGGVFRGVEFAELAVAEEVAAGVAEGATA